MLFDPREPYDGLPLLPPVTELETRAVLKQCLGATRALAELKGAGGLIPDQTILINTIPLQEAKLSSEIENIVTTQDELFHAALDEASATADPQAKEILLYRRALRRGYEAVVRRGVSKELLLEVGNILLGKEISFRSGQEIVYIGNQRAGIITYTPPRGGQILLDKLDNLEAFLLEKEGLDPLVRMAVAHYQFEAIHPFTDGNGRTGRILNLLYLVHARLLEIPVLYLSRFIIRNKGEYYRLLRGVTESGAWEPWLPREPRRGRRTLRRSRSRLRRRRPRNCWRRPLVRRSVWSVPRSSRMPGIRTWRPHRPLYQRLPSTCFKKRLPRALPRAREWRSRDGQHRRLGEDGARRDWVRA